MTNLCVDSGFVAVVPEEIVDVVSITLFFESLCLQGLRDVARLHRHVGLLRPYGPHEGMHELLHLLCVWSKLRVWGLSDHAPIDEKILG
jgi:hypothetical protein